MPDLTLVDDVLASMTESGRACAHPRLMTMPDGTVRRVRCHSRDRSYCPSCAAQNEIQSKRIIAAGFEKDSGSSAFYFLTLTAPSFGAVHLVPHAPTDELRRCRCGKIHRFGDPLAGVPLDMRRYRLRDQVKWNADSSELWRRTVRYLTASLPDLSWCCVREFQKRGTLHHHIIVRVPDSYDQGKVYESLLHAREYRTPSAGWGESVDVRRVSGADTTTDLVRYVGKMIGYVSKALGKSQDIASAEMRDFQSRLRRAASRLELSAKAVRGLGYAGQTMTRAASWCDLSKKSLHEEAVENAAELSDLYAHIADFQKRKVADMVAERYGSASDLVPPAPRPADIDAFTMSPVAVEKPSRKPAPTPWEVGPDRWLADVDDIDLIADQMLCS